MKYNENIFGNIPISPIAENFTIFKREQQFEAELEEKEKELNQIDQLTDEENWSNKFEEYVQWRAEQRNELSRLYEDFMFKLEQAQIYYYGCSFILYKETYNSRKNDFLNKFPKATELDFINKELSEGIKIIPYSFLNDKTQQKIILSLNSRFEFLQEIVNSYGLEIKHYPARMHSEYSNLENHEFVPKEKKQEPEETKEPLNLEKTLATEKIIYLQELGILDYLKELEPFNLSTNLLATVISAITGENASTLQSYLNPIVNPGAGQKNNPLKSTTKVKAVKQTLINIGFKRPK